MEEESAADRSAVAKRVWETIASSQPYVTPGLSSVEISEEDAPKGLRGTWYVNGLASCKIGDRMVHPFEAHGFVKAVTFDGDGGVRLLSRLVETEVQKVETWAGRPLYRGSMSNVADFKFPDFLLNGLSPGTRSVAQLAVRRWGDRLLATTDNAPWYSLSPSSLETLGVETLNGALRGESRMLAHTKVDSDREVLCATAVDFKVFQNETMVIFWEFDKDGNELSRIEHSSPFFIFHDWAITDEYYVVPANPGAFDVGKLGQFVVGAIPGTDMFDLDPGRNATLLLVPRGVPEAKGREAIEVDLGQFGTSFHVGPAWSDDKELTAHLLMFDRYEFGEEMGFNIRDQSFDPIPWSASNGGPKLHRVKVDLTSGELTEITKLADVPTDMPTFHPEREGKRCRYMYGTSGVREEGWFPFNALTKMDLEKETTTTWRPAEKRVADECSTSEPLFVPNPGLSKEDDGWVLSMLHNVPDNTTELLVFDAANFEAGPVWTKTIGDLWPWNVHTTFDPQI